MEVTWTVIATVAAVIAAVASLVTVALTIGYRREERARILAEALIAMISATERNPGRGSDVRWDAQFDEAIRQVERAAALSLLGFGSGVSEPVIGLLDPKTRSDPRRSFKLATMAFQRLLEEREEQSLLSRLPMLRR